MALIYRFKILAGRHAGDDNRAYGATGTGAEGGNIVESKVDLAKRFNVPGSQKFELLGTRQEEEPAPSVLSQELPQGTLEEAFLATQSTPATPTGGDTFDAMSVDELKQHAAAEEIDLGDARRKADIIAVLRAHS